MKFTSRTFAVLGAALALLIGAPSLAQSITGGGGVAFPVSTLNGGTGAALTPVVGDLLAADSTTSFARIAAPAVGQVLKSNGVGVAPSWSASPTLTSLALGGATIGSNALAVTGTANISGTLTVQGTGGIVSPGGLHVANFADLNYYTANGLSLGSGKSLAWSNTTNPNNVANNDVGFSRISAGVIGVGTGAQGSVAGSLQAASIYTTPTTTAGGPLIQSGTTGGYYAGVYASQYAIELGISTTLGGAPASAFGTLYYGVSSKYLTLGQGSSAATSISVGGANTLQLGLPDAASPVAQTIKFQDVVAGTLNTAGVNAIIQAPAGTGTGAGGSLIFQVAPAGSTGTAKNAWATALTIASNGNATFAQSVTVSGGVTVGPSNTLGWNAGSYFFGNATTGAATGTARIVGVTTTALNFGGDTSSFPALKRNGVGLEAVLADDSAFTTVKGKLTTDTAYTAGDPTTTGYLVVYDSTGTAYRVPALLN